MADQRCKHCRLEIYCVGDEYRHRYTDAITCFVHYAEPEDAAPAPRHRSLKAKAHDHEGFCPPDFDPKEVMTTDAPDTNRQYNGITSVTPATHVEAAECSCRKPDFQHAICPVHDTEAGARVAVACLWCDQGNVPVEGFHSLHDGRWKQLCLPAPVAQPGAGGARCWKYPDDVPLPVPECVTFPAQSLIIAANPDDQKLPWAVILEDRREMYDIADLSFSGSAIGKTDWSADNYWYPRMWIEISGVLTIEGRKARIEPAAGQVGAEQFWPTWWKENFPGTITFLPRPNAIKFAEAYAAHVTKGLEARFECAARKAGTAGGNYPQDCDWPFCGCDPKADRVLEAIQESGLIIVREEEDMNCTRCTAPILKGERYHRTKKGPHHATCPHVSVAVPNDGGPAVVTRDDKHAPLDVDTQAIKIVEALIMPGEDEETFKLNVRRVAAILRAYPPKIDTEKELQAEARNLELMGENERAKGLRVLPKTLMGGAVTVERAKGLRNEVGEFMWQRGINMGDKLDAGRVQDLLEEWASSKGGNHGS